jgi:ABC-type cobalamin transport system ATPase subunit
VQLRLSLLLTVQLRSAFVLLTSVSIAAGITMVPDETQAPRPALVGPNATCKSTLLRGLAGLGQLSGTMGIERPSGVHLISGKWRVSLCRILLRLSKIRARNHARWKMQGG